MLMVKKERIEMRVKRRKKNTETNKYKGKIGWKKEHCKEHHVKKKIRESRKMK